MVKNMYQNLYTPPKIPIQNPNFAPSSHNCNGKTHIMQTKLLSQPNNFKPIKKNSPKSNWLKLFKQGDSIINTAA